VSFFEVRRAHLPQKKVEKMLAMNHFACVVEIYRRRAEMLVGVVWVGGVVRCGCGGLGVGCGVGVG
jgi:hypothetical protein